MLHHRTPRHQHQDRSVEILDLAASPLTRRNSEKELEVHDLPSFHWSWEGVASSENRAERYTFLSVRTKSSLLLSIYDMAVR